MDVQGRRLGETIEQAGEDWKSLHLLCRRLTRSPAPECPLFDKTGTLRFAAKDRVKILAEHLEEQFTPHTPSDTPEAAPHHVQVERLVEEFLMAPVPPLPELEDGPCHCHTESRQGPRLATSQRPITLLSHIAKLFERIALRRLLRHLTPRQEQFGFRSGHSTTLQLARVLHHMAAEHNRVVVPSVFLDIEGVRPSVAPGLVFKLLNTQIPPALVRTVASFLEGRSFFVAVEDATSDPRPIHAGVPQGSCLSPCLYGVYTDDIPTLAVNYRTGRRTSYSRYTLTTVRTSHHPVGLTWLRPKSRWLNKWRVAVNVTKTAALLTGQQRTMPPKLRLRGQDVEWQTKVRYLGVQIDRSMRMAAQVEQVIHQAEPREHAAPSASIAPAAQGQTPYKGYIRSRLTYAAPAWYALCSTSQRKRIQAQQSIALRMIVGAGRYVLNDVIARDLCIETVKEFIQRIARRMLTSLIRAHMDSSGTSHRRTRGRRAADRSSEKSPKRLPPNSEAEPARARRLIGFP
ncbi:RNA-directed DNA polymerase from mobile element jockey [Eumeta japonica]|uniref:RNA-directed DNA polymerase from mobile element jockey n=1 Tax=Eumeta variegata TaxID=151549 RepID=A0A4C1ZNU9_EUMVA|nr:RNA-directed DNA polymerase from mobile element jockey [Eumeta japonica]